MGLKKDVGRTVNINVPFISGSCLKVVSGLNELEQLLEVHFPSANEETAMPHLNLQEAWYNYCLRLSDAIEMMRLENHLGVIDASKSKFGEVIPNFVKYLQQFGSVSFGAHVDSRKSAGRVGVFLARIKTPRLIGLLESGQNHLAYSGYVPIKISETEFHRTPVYHLGSSGFDSGNFAYVRLFAEKRDGQVERTDGFKERGIEFP